MTIFLRLMLDIRSEAINLQNRLSDTRYRNGCRRMSKYIDDTVEQWHGSSLRAVSGEDDYLGLTISSFWCDVLSTSTMILRGEQLRGCAWQELEGQVVRTSALFFALGKGYKSESAQEQVAQVCESLAHCCHQLMHGTRSASPSAPSDESWPLPRMMLLAAPDHSQAPQESASSEPPTGDTPETPGPPQRLCPEIMRQRLSVYVSKPSSGE